MAQKRKLQVFVSSTFIDLKEERQAAVEAILTTGHIPAGMELFAGKNEEQMNIIKEWIDRSDIYMLILGGRYGSVELSSGKSYTHLEYEHAQKLGKPVFVVVASDAYINQKVVANEGKLEDIIEQVHQEKYDAFKIDITGRYVKFWNNRDQLQLAIINTLHALERDENLIGWIPGSEATNSGAIAEEMARLAKENADLRTKVDSLSKPINNTLYNGLTYEQVCSLLNQSILTDSSIDERSAEIMVLLAEAFSNKEPTLLHFFYQLKMKLDERQEIKNAPPTLHWAIHKLVEYNLLAFVNSNKQVFTITEAGYYFNLRLQVEYNVGVNQSLLRKYQPPGIQIL